MIAAGLVLALAGGCASADVLNSSPYGIWIKEPSVGSGGADDVAEDHCRKFGRQAVYMDTIRVADTLLRPVRVYDCR